MPLPTLKRLARCSLHKLADPLRRVRRGVCCRYKIVRVRDPRALRAIVAEFDNGARLVIPSHDTRRWAQFVVRGF